MPTSVGFVTSVLRTLLSSLSVYSLVYSVRMLSIRRYNMIYYDEETDSYSYVEYEFDEEYEEYDAGSEPVDVPF